jgi:hypothetical protein
VHVDGPAVGREVPLPDFPDEVGAAEHRRRVGGEKGQQLELLKGQRDLGAVHPDPPLVLVKQQPGTPGRGLTRCTTAGKGRPVKHRSVEHRTIADE